jgi:hypothetical protein
MMPVSLQARRPDRLSLGRALAGIVAGDQPPMDLGDWTPGRRNPMTGRANPLGALLGADVPRRREVGPPSSDGTASRLMQQSGPMMGAPDREPGPVEPEDLTMVDNSPPGLEPINMPGGNEPTPIMPTRADRPDYAAMLQQALGPAPKMSTGQKIAAIVGPALMAATGNEQGASAFLNMLAQRRDERARQEHDAALTGIKWRREDDLAEQKRNEPRYFSGNEDQVRFDPASGQATRVYDAPQDFEDYAAAGGLTPGTPEYFRAVEDYVLRGNGPTAFKYDRDLEAIKNAQRITLEAERQRNRTTLRGTPSYRDLNPPPPRAAAPRSGPARQSLPVVGSPAEAMKLPSGTRFKTPDGKVKVRP